MEIFDFFVQNREMIYFIILAVFVGIEAIIVMLDTEPDNYFGLILGFLAVILGTLNVVGGFVVTDRMLEMFKKK